MKYLFVVIAFSAVTLAEVPPSKSYLPPSPASRNAGYPQGPQSGPAFPGAPEVIAARNLGQGAYGRGNSFSRSSSHDHASHGRVGVDGSQGYDDSASAFGRNLIDASSEPANYNFEYMVNDFNEGTDFGHHEERVEEKAQGQYHVVLPDGRKQTVSYEADERGFKPQVSYQDSDFSNGYDGNANTRSHGNGYNANANIHGNGYDASTRSHGNGYDANASTRSHGNTYDINANTRSHGNGFNNGGHNDDTRGY